MKAQSIGFAALLLIFGGAFGSRIKVCGSVLMPEGQSFTSGELVVRTTREKIFVISTITQPSDAIVDPTTKTFCIERDNGTDIFLNSYRFRVSVIKTSAPSIELYTGNFTEWKDAEGSSSTYLVPGKNYDFYMDIVYLGSTDPLSRRLFLPGLKTYATSQEAQEKEVSYDTHSNLNKIVAQTFPNGNLVRDGSFEEMDSQWELASPVSRVKPLAIKPYMGNRSMVVSFPTTSSGHPLVSDAFQMKPSTSYTLSFYYKSSEIAGTVKPAVISLPARGTPVGSGTVNAGSTSYSQSSEWTRYSQTFTTNSQAGFGRISLLEFSAASPGSGVLAFDGVVLEEGNVSSQEKITFSTKFFDGLNRSIQSMQAAGETDIYSQTVYDDLGRASVSTLPIGFDYFRHNGRHAYLENLFDGPYGGHLNYYYGSPDPVDPETSTDPHSPGPKAKGFPYAQTTYEASPLGRISRTISAGGAWRGDTPEEDHDLRHYFGSVGAGAVFLNDNTGVQYADQIPTSLVDGYFLHIAKGENGELFRSYTDKFGRARRREAKIGNGWIATTKEYDALGNLSSITAPPGPNEQSVTTHLEYNSLKQLLAESSPDFGTNKTIYDQRGRLRFTQTQVQCDKGSFSYLKYDNIDRPIEAGEYMDAASFASVVADNPDFPELQNQTKKVSTRNYYDEVPLISDGCNDGSTGEKILIAVPNEDVPPGFFPNLATAYNETKSRLSGMSSYAWPLNFLQLYSSANNEITPPLGMEFTAIPVSDGSLVGFEINGLASGSAEYSLALGVPLPFPVQWGPLKGRLTKTISCNQSLAGTPAGLKDIAKYFNYDKYGNSTEIYEYNGYMANEEKRWQKTTQSFDIQRRPLSKENYADASSSTPLFRFTYKYDALDRMDQVIDQNGDVIARNHYNLIGQLSSIVLGKAGPGQLTVGYQYHFRGWVKEISAVKPSGERIYHQVIKYEDGSLPRFDGSISEYNYALVADAMKKFSFEYDDMDRLVSANTELTSPGLKDGGHWEYEYAKNGSLSKMHNASQVYDYGYVSGNQLDHVIVTGTSPAYDRSGVGNFVYDASGRMTVDESKKMDLAYDEHSGLPARFSLTEGADVRDFYMVYDESGSRISKLEYQGSLRISAKHYTKSGKEIRETSQGLVEVYPFENFGRIVKNSTGQWTYEAFIKNNLGSVSKVYNLTDNAESYRTDNEPFGKLRLQTVSTDVELTQKFTGKEHDEKIDLDYFGARYYDPELAVWISPDPSRQFSSPYSYTGNGSNPVNKSDPDGKQIGMEYGNDQPYDTGPVHWAFALNYDAGGEIGGGGHYGFSIVGFTETREVSIYFNPAVSIGWDPGGSAGWSGSVAAHFGTDPAGSDSWSGAFFNLYLPLGGIWGVTGFVSGDEHMTPTTAGWVGIGVGGSLNVLKTFRTLQALGNGSLSYSIKLLTIDFSQFPKINITTFQHSLQFTTPHEGLDSHRLETKRFSDAMK